MSGACAQCGTGCEGIFCVECLGRMPIAAVSAVRKLVGIGALGTARAIGREALLDGAPGGTAARQLAEPTGEEVRS